MGRTYRQSLEYATAKFWSHVEKTPECWIWAGQIDRDGYGISYWQGSQRKAHRISYALAGGGDLEPGITVDHLCFMRNCVRPEHLRAVPHSVNAARQRSALATHCQQVHEYTDKNTYRTKAGNRQCRTCQATCASRYRAKKKGKAS